MTTSHSPMAWGLLCIGSSTGMCVMLALSTKVSCNWYGKGSGAILSWIWSRSSLLTLPKCVPLFFRSFLSLKSIQRTYNLKINLEKSRLCGVELIGGLTTFRTCMMSILLWVLPRFPPREFLLPLHTYNQSSFSPWEIHG